MEPFREPFSHAREAASSRLCVGLQLKPIRQVFFRADFFWHIFDFLDFKSCFLWKNCNKLTLLMFFGPAATYRTGFFSCGFCFWHIFYFLDFKSCFIWKKYTQLNILVMLFKIFKEFSRPYPGELLEGPGGHVTPPLPPFPPPPRGDRGQGPGNKNSPK